MTDTKARITVDQLRELLEYQPDTGAFIWIVRRSQIPPGTRAAEKIDQDGYAVIKVLGRRYRAHRLAFLWMTGKWPVGLIDHRDGNAANTAWVNLRPATFTQNRANSKTPKNNKSGFKGVRRSSVTAKRPWIAQIKHNRKTIYLGSFSCPTRAWLEYARSARRLFGEYASTTR